MRRGRAVAAALVAPVLFGTIGTARVLGPDISSWTVTWGRCLVAATVLAAVLAGSGRFRLLTAAARQAPVLVAAGCQAVFQVCFLTAVLRTGVATATLVTIGTVPLFTGVLSRRIGRTWAVATLLAICGVTLIVSAGSTGGPDAAGVGLAVTAGLSYAVYLVALERLAGRVDPEAVVGATFALVVVLMVPGMLLAGDAAELLTVPGLLLVLWLGVAATAVAYVLVSRALAGLPPATVSTLALAEPPVAAVLAVTVLGETITPLGVLGAVLVGAGLLLLTRSVMRGGAAPQVVAVRVAPVAGQP